MNLNEIIKNISIRDISFVFEVNKKIDINKFDKPYYFEMFRIELDYITNFINNLRDNEVYLINPKISINHTSNPYLSLSNQFLVTNNSNPELITNFLNFRLDIAREDFKFVNDYYWLIFKYKRVELNYKYLC